MSEIRRCLSAAEDALKTFNLLPNNALLTKMFVDTDRRFV